jgi:hypothetical protein
MSYGGIAVVIDPPEIREMVQEWAAAIIEQHASPTDSAI